MLTTGWMYMLECSDGTFYTGSTNNLTLRLHQHQVGEGANYTKKRLPVKLVYSEEFERIDDAFYREKQVQGWNRKKKEALMKGDTELLKELSKSRAASLNSDMASNASHLSAMASTTSPLSAMASTGSATADKTATAENAATLSRISITGESMAVAIAVAELAEAVEATNLVGNATADKTATTENSSTPSTTKHLNN
jgi:predicted GIY-YIG superfamily endonuclease